MLRLGKGRALALAGVQHDTAGNTLFRVGILNGVIDDLQVMSVDLLRVEAKGRGLFGEVAVGQNVVRGTVQLIAVFVNKIDEVVQLVGVGKVESLPDLALIGLAIAYNAENMIGTAINLVAEGGAGGRGGTLS